MGEAPESRTLLSWILKDNQDVGGKKTEEEENARQGEQPVLRHRGCRDVPRESQVVPCGIS